MCYNNIVQIAQRQVTVGLLGGRNALWRHLNRPVERAYKATWERMEMEIQTASVSTKTGTYMHM